MHHQKPNTVRLTIHLPDQENTTFKDSDMLTEIMKSHHDTTLMAWFKLNTQDPAVRQYYYRDIPKHYT